MTIREEVFRAVIDLELPNTRKLHRQLNRIKLKLDSLKSTELSFTINDKKLNVLTKNTHKKIQSFFNRNAIDVSLTFDLTHIKKEINDINKLVSRQFALEGIGPRGGVTGMSAAQQKAAFSKVKGFIGGAKDEEEVRKRIEEFTQQAIASSEASGIVGLANLTVDKITSILAKGLSQEGVAEFKKFSELSESEIQALYVTLVGNSIIPDMMDEINAVIKKGFNSSIETFKNFSESATNLLGELRKSLRRKIIPQKEPLFEGQATGFTPVEIESDDVDEDRIRESQKIILSQIKRLNDEAKAGNKTLNQFNEAVNRVPLGASLAFGKGGNLAVGLRTSLFGIGKTNNGFAKLLDTLTGAREPASLLGKALSKLAGQTVNVGNETTKYQDKLKETAKTIALYAGSLEIQSNALKAIAQEESKLGDGLLVNKSEFNEFDSQLTSIRKEFEKIQTTSQSGGRITSQIVRAQVASVQTLRQRFEQLQRAGIIDPDGEAFKQMQRIVQESEQMANSVQVMQILQDKHTAALEQSAKRAEFLNKIYDKIGGTISEATGKIKIFIKESFSGLVRLFNPVNVAKDIGNLLVSPFRILKRNIKETTVSVDEFGNVIKTTSTKSHNSLSIIGKGIDTIVRGVKTLTFLNPGALLANKLTKSSKIISTLNLVKRGFWTGIGEAIQGAFIKATSALAAFPAKAIQSASDVEEMRSKFKVVFGDIAEQVEISIDSMARAYGRNTNALQGMASGFQDMLVPMGGTREEAAKWSQVITGAVVNLSSFNNLREESVKSDIQSLLAGETQVARKYGVTINEAALDQELLNQGFEVASRNATPYQKGIASLTLLLKGNADALDLTTDENGKLVLGQGDAIRTSQEFANQQRRLISILQNTKEAIGEKLLPILNPFLRTLNTLAEFVLPKVVEGFQFVLSFVTPFTDRLATAFSEGTLLDPIKPFLAGIHQIISAIMAGDWENAWNTFLGVVNFALNQVGEAVVTGGINTIKKIVEFINRVRDTFVSLVNNVIIDGAKFLGNKLLEVLGFTFDINSGIGRLGAILGEAFDWGFSFAVQIAEGIIDAASSIIQSAVEFIGDIIGSFLEPGSPPEKGPLSTIDKWGAPLMNTYLKGFKSADFKLLKTALDPVKKIFAERFGAAGFDSFTQVRSKFAELLSDINTTGDVDENKWTEISGLIGEGNEELKTLLKLQLDYQAATQKVQDLEAEVSAAERAGFVSSDLKNKLAAAKETEKSAKESIATQQEYIDFVSLSREEFEQFASSVQKDNKKLVKDHSRSASKMEKRTKTRIDREEQFLNEGYQKEKELLQQQFDLGVLDEDDYLKQLIRLEEKYVETSLKKGVPAGLDAHVTAINEAKEALDVYKNAQKSTVAVNKDNPLFDNIFGSLPDFDELAGDSLGEGLFTELFSGITDGIGEQFISTWEDVKTNFQNLVADKIPTSLEDALVIVEDLRFLPIKGLLGQSITLLIMARDKLLPVLSTSLEKIRGTISDLVDSKFGDGIKNFFSVDTITTVTDLIKNLKENISALRESGEDLIKGLPTGLFIGLIPVVGLLVVKFGGLFRTIFDLSTVFLSSGDAAGKLVGQFTPLTTITDKYGTRLTKANKSVTNMGKGLAKFRGILGAGLTAIKELNPILGIGIDLFSSLGGTLLRLTKTGREMFTKTLLPRVKEFLLIIKGGLPAIKQSLIKGLTLIRGAIVRVLPTILKLSGVLAAVAAFAYGVFSNLGLLSDIFDDVKQRIVDTVTRIAKLFGDDKGFSTFEDVTSRIGEILLNLLSTLETIGKSVLPGIQKTFAGVFTFLHGVVQATIFPVIDIFTGLFALIKGDSTLASEAFLAAWNGVNTGLGHIFGGIITIVTGLLTGLVDLITEILASIFDVFGFGDVIREGGGSLTEFVDGIGESFTGAFSSLFAGEDTFGNIFNSLFDNLKTNAQDFISDIPLIGELFGKEDSASFIGRLFSSAKEIVNSEEVTTALLGLREALTLLGDEVGKILPTLLEAFDNIKVTFISALPLFIQIKESFGELLSLLFEVIPLETVKDVIAGIAKGLVVLAGTGLLTGLATLVSVLKGVVRFLTVFVNGLSTAIRGITAIIKGFVLYFSGILKVIVGVLTLDGDKVRDGFLDIWTGIQTLIGGIFQTILGTVHAFVGGIAAGVFGAFEGFIDFFINLANQFLDKPLTTFSEFKDKVIGFILEMKNKAVELFGKMLAFFKGEESLDIDANALAGKLGTLVGNIIGNLLAFVTVTLPTWISDLTAKIKDFFAGAIAGTALEEKTLSEALEILLVNVIASTLEFVFIELPTWIATLSEYISNLFYSMKDWLTENGPDIALSLFEGLKTLVISAIDFFILEVPNLKTKIVAAFSSLLSGIGEGLSETAPPWLTQMFGIGEEAATNIQQGANGADLDTFGQGIVNDLGSGIEKGVSNLDAPLGFLADLFPHSPAKTGPLSSQPNWRTWMDIPSFSVAITEISNLFVSKIKEGVTGVISSVAFMVKQTGLLLSVMVSNSSVFIGKFNSLINSISNSIDGMVNNLRASVEVIAAVGDSVDQLPDKINDLNGLDINVLIGAFQILANSTSVIASDMTIAVNKMREFVAEIRDLQNSTADVTVSVNKSGPAFRGGQSTPQTKNQMTDLENFRGLANEISSEGLRSNKIGKQTTNNSGTVIIERGAFENAFPGVTDSNQGDDLMRIINERIGRGRNLARVGS